MRNSDLLLVSIKNIVKNKVKFSLVSLSICIGIISVTVISSIGSIAQNIIDGELQSMGIDGITIIDTSSQGLLDDNFLEKVRNMFDVDVAMPIIYSYGSYSNEREQGNAMVWGVTQEVEELLNMNVLYGRTFTASDIDNAKKVIVIDENLAQTLYQRTNIIGKEISISVDGYREYFEVIGVISDQKAFIDSMFSDIAPSFIYLPITIFSNISASSSYDQIAIRADDRLQKVMENIEYYIFKNDELKEELQVQNISGYMDSISNITLYITRLLTAIAGISMIVAAIGVINMMLSSTTERRKEIGIYLALGAKREYVWKIFFIESVIICLFSGILGGIIGMLIVFVATTILQIDFYISTNILITIILISLFCGVISGIFPSIKASRLNPIEVLRE